MREYMNYKKKLKKNKILVTGSAGFIGFHVCKIFLKIIIQFMALNLNNYYDVKFKKDRTNYLKNNFKNYKFSKIDISDKKKLDKF